jgi:hypothetical protein
MFLKLCCFILNSPHVIPANFLSGNLAVNALSRRFPIKTLGRHEMEYAKIYVSAQKFVVKA